MSEVYIKANEYIEEYIGNEYIEYIVCCSNNRMHTVDLRNSVNIKTIYLSNNNNLTNLYLPITNKLKYFYCDNCPISILDLRIYPLKELTIMNTKMSSLFLNNTNIHATCEILYIKNNPLNRIYEIDEITKDNITNII